MEWGRPPPAWGSLDPWVVNPVAYPIRGRPGPSQLAGGDGRLEPATVGLEVRRPGVDSRSVREPRLYADPHPDGHCHLEPACCFTPFCVN